MASRQGKIFWYCMSGLLAVALLWVAFKGVSWGDFWTGLKACDWGWVVVSMVVSGGVCLLRGWRWKMLLRPIDRSTKLLTCFNAVNISYVASMAIPRIGELVRCGYITKRSRMSPDGVHKLASYDKVLGTVVVERGFDASMLVVLMLGILAALWSRFGSFFSEKMLIPISDSFSLNIVWLVGVIFAGIAVFIWAVWRFREKSGFCMKVWGFVLGIWKGITQSFKMKSWPKFLLVTVAIWVSYWITSECIILAVQGIDASLLPAGVAEDLAGLDIVDALFLMFVGGLSSLVPVPGGFGAFHYLVSLALSTMYGIPTEVGVIFATLSHESMAATEIILGALSYGYETIKK